MNVRALGKLPGIIPAQGIRRQGERDAGWEASWRGWDWRWDKEQEEEGTGIQAEHGAQRRKSLWPGKDRETGPNSGQDEQAKQESWM